MVDAPERIWTTERDYRKIRESKREENPTEYVRADLYEQVKRERDDAKQALQNEIVAHGNTIRGKAERLAGARVKATSDELSRYIERCRELSDGGEYSWWSRLAEILSALTEPAGEAESVAYALIVDGECEEIGWGPFPYDYEDPAVIRLYTTPPKTNSIKKYDWFEES